MNNQNYPGGFPLPNSNYPGPAQPGMSQPPGSIGFDGSGSYPPQPGCYPPQQSGYPPQQGGGFPMQMGGYPPQQGGIYPPQQGGSFPPQQGTYPPQQGGGFPPQQGGFPPQQGSFPPQQGGFPPQQGGFPPQQGGFPPQQGGFPPQQGGGYPPQQGGSFPPQQGAHPPQQGGAYPPQQGGAYPPQQGGAYPPQQGGTYPPQQGGTYPSQQGGVPGSSHHGSPAVQATPTVHPAHPFDPERDSQILRKAMKGLGTDEAAIIQVLSRRSRAQRLEIVKIFKAAYGKDLLKELKSELSGRLEDVILALVLSEADYDAKELHRAMSGAGTDEKCLIEILCSRSNAQIRAINDSYQKMYKTKLESDIRKDTSGYFSRLLVSLSSGNRMESARVDLNKAQADAQVLYSSGEKRWGTDEAEFNRVFALQSFPQLRALFDAYSRVSSRGIEAAIKSEMSGDVSRGYLSLVKVIRNPSAFFAESLYQAMKGLGTEDNRLIRVVTTRCEVDMVQIKQAYQATYGRPLAQAIQSDVSGDYQRILLALVGA